MDWDYPKRGTERTALAVARIAEINAGLPRVTELRPDEARRMFDVRWAAYARSLMTGRVAVTDHILPLGSGPMRVRVYEVSPPRINPRLVIFLHGGGWVMRSPETSDFVCEQLAIDLNCSIASLDYPLAPENPCPAAVEACVQAIRYMAADQDGMWPSGPYGICGESAGANIALAAMLQLKRDPVAPAAALLVYGVYDDDHSTISHRLYGNGDFGISSADMAWYWSQYLAGSDPRAQLQARPLHGDMRGLPPMFLACSEFDCLRDDTARLAAKLQDAGVAHETHLVREAIHGCLNISPLFPELSTMRHAAARFIGAYL